MTNFPLRPPARSVARAAAGRPHCRARAMGLALLATLMALALVQPAIAADPAVGRKKAVQCQVCHGIDGIAQMPIAPHIAGESSIYLETQLKAFRSGKREHEIMSVVAKGLSDEDIADLAAWYSSIKFEVTLPE